MIKFILEKYVRKTKNSDFAFDPDMSDAMLRTYVFYKVVELLRGLKFYRPRARGPLLQAQSSVEGFLPIIQLLQGSLQR